MRRRLCLKVAGQVHRKMQAGTVAGLAVNFRRATDIGHPRLHIFQPAAGEVGVSERKAAAIIFDFNMERVIFEPEA